MVIFLKHLSDKQYQKELQEIREINKQKEYRSKLKFEKDKYKKHFKIETSKILAIYLFAMLNAIVIYAMVAMWKFVDFTYLGVLITDIAAQIMIYAIYCMKAYKAKKSEEDLKFEREKLSGSLRDVLSAGAESGEYVPTTTGNVEVFTTNSEDAVG